MRVMVVLLALASAFALAADNVVIAPQSTASHKPQATPYGAEAITIPQMLSYQGKLTDTLGQPVTDSTYSVTFRLFTVPSGGTAFWNETQSVTTKGGLFSVLLGSVTPIGSVPDAGALYLGMAVAGTGALTPRLRIVSAAYAYKADTANYALAAAGIGGSGTAGYAARWTGAGTLGNSSIRDTGGGSIAVGDTIIHPSWRIYGNSPNTDTTGVGVYARAGWYWGGIGYRYNYLDGSGYNYDGTRGGLLGGDEWGSKYTFGTAGYTIGDDSRCGGAIGGEWMGATWGSLGYKNSSGNWYAGYGTAAWTTGSGKGIGCGYIGGLMGGWLKGTYYGATVSGDRYALYTKGNNFTSGYSAVMQNTGGKREASYVPTSTTVDIYTSGVAEMHNGQATVSFPASFASMVSKNVPVVVTATPMGPAPIYLSSSDNNGFAVAAVDAKASVKFSWIAVGRRAGYEMNPDVPAELTKTDFDDKMDGVMSDENDLHHSATPVWFDGTQLRFDAPPEPIRPHHPAQPTGAER